MKTPDYGDAVGDLVRRGGGERNPEELLSHLAPLGWEHINLTGDYLWSANRMPSTVGYRPLRAPTELLAA
ncbi:hypothetical protein J2849_006694 [Azospirillum melinis]|nr:hypothetical protein [Azospirillum melinis]